MYVHAAFFAHWICFYFSISRGKMTYQTSFDFLNFMEYLIVQLILSACHVTRFTTVLHIGMLFLMYLRTVVHVIFL